LGGVIGVQATISVILLLGPTLVFGFMGKPTEMGIAAAAGAVAAAFVNIDKMERFKGAGFEAEMKHAVEEVYATRDALRQVARPLIAATLQILTKGDRWGGMDPHEKHIFRSDLERLAGDLDLAGDATLKAAHEDFFHYHIWDHFTDFARRVSKIDAIPTDIRQQLSQLANYSSADLPARERIESILGEHKDKLGQEERELLDDYLYYRDKRSLRRQEALRRE
jgi:hypothetical protein